MVTPLDSVPSNTGTWSSDDTSDLQRRSSIAGKAVHEQTLKFQGLPTNCQNAVEISPADAPPKRLAPADDTTGARRCRSRLKQNYRQTAALLRARRENRRPRFRKVLQGPISVRSHPTYSDRIEFRGFYISN